MKTGFSCSSCSLVVVLFAVAAGIWIFKDIASSLSEAAPREERTAPRVHTGLGHNFEIFDIRGGVRGGVRGAALAVSVPGDVTRDEVFRKIATQAAEKYAKRYDEIYMGIWREGSRTNEPPARWARWRDGFLVECYSPSPEP